MEEDFYKRVADLIRRKRRMREYSQEYMAAKLGISQVAYHKIENGKTRCSAFVFRSVFNILEISKDELLLIFFDQSTTGSKE